MEIQTIRKILTRDFILCFLAQLALAFVIHILTPTLPIYLSRLGSTEVEIGFLIGIFGVSALVFRPFIGRALIKIPEKTFLVAGALLSTLTSVAYLLAPPFWPLFIVRAFQGIGFSFFSTASFILITNISPEAHRGQSLSYFLLAPNIALALAPSFGMFLINHFSFTLLFWVCSGLSLCSLFITNRLRRRQVVPVEDSSVEDGFLLSWKALPPSIIGFSNHFIWGTITAFFSLYAINRGVTNPGLFFTAVAVILISGRALGGRILDLYSRERIILPCLITSIISMGILAFSKTQPMFILVAAIWGIGPAFLIPSLMTYTLDRVDSSRRGPAVATFTAMMDLGVALGPVVMGFVIHLTNYPIMFLCLALIGVINFNYFYFLVRKKR